MVKRKSTHPSLQSENINKYESLVADIIINALEIISGQVVEASLEEILDCKIFLKSETAQRWAGVVGIDLALCLAHEDSIINLED